MKNNKFLKKKRKKKELARFIKWKKKQNLNKKLFDGKKISVNKFGEME